MTSPIVPETPPATDREAANPELPFGWGWLVVAFTAAVAVIGLSVTADVSTERAIKAEVQNVLTSTLETTLVRIHNWRRERLDDITILAQSPEILSVVRHVVAANAQADANPDSAIFQDLDSLMFPALSAWQAEHYFVLVADGTILASSNRSLLGATTAITPEDDFMNHTFGGQSDMVLVPYGDPIRPEYDFFIGTPVRDDGRVIAVLVFSLDLANEFSAKLALGTSRESVETYAFTRQGILLTESRFNDDLVRAGLLKKGEASIFNVDIRDPGGDLTRGHTTAVPRNRQPLTRMAASAGGGTAGRDLEGYRDYRGVPVVGIWQWVEDLGLGVSTEMEVSEAYQSLKLVRYQMLGVGVLSAGLIVGLALIFVFGRRRTWLSAQRARTVLNNALDGMIVISAQGIVESFNPAAELIFGYRADEVIGRNVKMLMPESYKGEHDGYLSNYMSSGVRKIIGIGREVEGQRKDGSHFPLDLAVSEMTLPGERRFLGIVRDISERKAAALAILRSQENLSSAQRIAHLGGWSRDIPTGELEWSEEIYRIFGLSPETHAPTYENFLGAIHPDDRDKVQAAAGKSLKNKTPYSIEHRIIRPDGSVRYVHEQGEVQLDERGAAKRMIGSVLDITERKEAERAKSEFVSTVSHELRTPLTSIHGSLGLLVGGAAGDLEGRAKQLLDVAYSSSDRLIRLINDILDAEKLGAGKMVFNFTEHQHHNLIDAALSANRAYADKYGVRLEHKGGSGNIVVHVDVDRFAQVMANLLSNAIKFSPQGATVTVSTAVIGKTVRTCVSDRGPGIPQSFQGHLFKQFTQEDSSDTRGKGGTGLGLSISKSIVEHMGGEIGFETEAGKGTTFYFDLPVKIDQPKSLADAVWDETAEAASRTAGGTLPRILVCDDDSNICRMITLALEGEAETLTARSLAAARRHLGEAGFDLVILDIGLDRENGLDLLDDLARAGSDAPVIVYTALDDPVSIDHRVHEVLTKSRTSPGELLDRVRNIIRRGDGAEMSS